MKGPHDTQPVLEAGAELGGARAAVILVHGRGATAESILSLADQLDPGSVAFFAPQAAGFTWYPNSFMAPIEHNEPGLSSGLALLDAIVERVSAAGVPVDRQVLLGFSQGACLTLEYVVRHPRRYGGVVGLTGGLIGPPGTEWSDRGSVDGTPIFLGSSDPDPHVPWARVVETAGTFESLGGRITLRRYAGLGHTINREELDAARAIITTARSKGAT